jgi:hypothetical protein
VKRKKPPPPPPPLDPFADPPDPPAKDIVLAQQRRDALALHKAGKTYEDIAEVLYVSVSTAKRVTREAVRALAGELVDTTPDEHRAVALMQINDLYCVASAERDVYMAETKAFRETEGREGKIPSLGILIDIQEHMHRLLGTKAKLLGLNAALKVEGSGAAMIGLADLQKFQAAMDANAGLLPEPPEKPS